MKNYSIKINLSGKFERPNYLKVGTVKANNRAEAKRKAEDERKGRFSDDCKFTKNMDHDTRPFIIELD